MTYDLLRLQISAIVLMKPIERVHAIEMFPGHCGETTREKERQ